LIEPQRAALIPGFADVKRAALTAGALGCTISGAGPAVFALTDATCAVAVRDAMVAAFQSAAGLAATGWISKIRAQGAAVV
jgi:homoserine kinase